MRGDLVWAILEHCESYEVHPEVSWRPSALARYDAADVSRQVGLCAAVGLLWEHVAEDGSHCAIRLTSAGHDELRRFRSQLAAT